MTSPVGTTVVLFPRRADDVPVTDPRGPAREAARRELSKHMYQGGEPNPVQRALDWIWRRVGELFGAASGAAPGGGLGLMAIALAVVLLAVALRLRLGTLRRLTATTGELFDDRPLSADQHRAAAERHVAANRWNEALQERMRAVVRSLEERALLEPRAGRTAAEAAAEAGTVLPDRAEALRAAARDFDDVTYGGRTATAEAYARIRDLDLAVRHDTPRLVTGPRGSGR